MRKLVVVSMAQLATSEKLTDATANATADTPSEAPSNSTTCSPSIQREASHGSWSSSVKVEVQAMTSSPSTSSPLNCSSSCRRKLRLGAEPRCCQHSSCYSETVWKLTANTAADAAAEATSNSTTGGSSIQREVGLGS